MARPKLYDDDRLLGLVAAFRVWGGIRIKDKAIEAALELVRWPPRVAKGHRNAALARLRAAYRRQKVRLEQEARSRGPAGWMPTLLTLPDDPELSGARLHARQAVDKLRYVAQTAAIMADLLQKQARGGGMPNADLMRVADGLHNAIGSLVNGRNR